MSSKATKAASTEAVRDNGSGLSDEPHDDCPLGRGRAPLDGREEACRGNAVLLADATDRDKWDEFVAGHREANFLQSWDFYEFHASRGRVVVRRMLMKNEAIVAAYAGVVETARRGRHLAVAGGPIVDWNDREVVEAVFADMREQGEQQGCAWVRVRPQLEESEDSLRLMRKLGLVKAPMYLSVEYAGILDLTRPEEEIVAGAAQGFRRKLRKAEKAGIEVEAGTSSEAVEEFCQLEQEHAARQGYVAFSEEFLHKQFEAFFAHGEALIYTARKDGEVLAQNFMIFYGAEASYHYGVSSMLGTRYSAAPLLHLAAMQEARRRGCTRYNLWGIVGREETEHRFYGVSEFKRSFGCEELRYTPAHDMVLKLARYQLNKAVEVARKRRRHV